VTRFDQAISAGLGGSRSRTADSRSRAAAMAANAARMSGVGSISCLMAINQKTPPSLRVEPNCGRASRTSSRMRPRRLSKLPGRVGRVIIPERKAEYCPQSDRSSQKPLSLMPIPLFRLTRGAAASAGAAPARRRGLKPELDIRPHRQRDVRLPEGHKAAWSIAGCKDGRADHLER